MKSNMTLYKSQLFIENQGIIKLVFSSLLVFFWCLLDHDVFGESVSRKEGDSVTLHTGVETNQQEKIRWYFDGVQIAQISGDLSFICTDVQCKDGEERFRDRLKLDHQTGSLTIINIRTTDSGEYTLKVIHSSGSSEKIFNVTIYGFFADGEDGVLVFLMEGDSVTFQTRVKTNQQERMRWYFNSSRIAEITGDLSKICTDVQCNSGTERFRDRLKLDNQTGSLTIINITNTDAGLYHLKTSINNERDKTFIFAIRGVSAAEQNETNSVMEGESVTLHPGKIENPNDCKMWYFKDIFFVQITGDQSKICSVDQCDERFRDRLEVDHQTGSLTITNMRITDSGVYKLQINSGRFSIIRSFSVTVTAVPASGLSSVAAGVIHAAIAVGVLLLVAAVVFWIYRWHRSRTGTADITELQNLNN